MGLSKLYAITGTVYLIDTSQRGKPSPIKYTVPVIPSSSAPLREPPRDTDAKCGSGSHHQCRILAQDTGKELADRIDARYVPQVFMHQ